MMEIRMMEIEMIGIIMQSVLADFLKGLVISSNPLKPYPLNNYFSALLVVRTVM